jgi:hypothetical protein
MPKYLSESERAALEKLLEDDKDDDDAEEIEHNGKKYRVVKDEAPPAGDPPAGDPPADPPKPTPRRRFVT